MCWNWWGKENVMSEKQERKNMDSMFELWTYTYS